MTTTSSAAAPPALTVLEQIPPGLFSTPADRLHSVLPGPTLLRLPGRQPEALFFSVLLHGNETSGWEALCQLLQQPRRLERSVVLFIGNVAAAAAHVRTLPNQMDFNRLWRGDHRYRSLADAVLRQLSAQSLFAAVDFHNNTGRNPHYTVLTEVTAATTALASLFSDRAVVVNEPDTVLTRALQPLCPATTVEVGPIGDPAGADRSLQLMHTYLALTSIPTEPAPALQLHRARARVFVRDEIAFGFADELRPRSTPSLDLILTAGIEGVNFHALPAGTEFGFAQRPLTDVLKVLDPAQNDVTEYFFEADAGRIVLRQPAIPAMYTTDRTVIQQDCLCYLMERLP